MTLELFHFKDSEDNDFTLPKTIASGALRKSRHESSEINMFFGLLEDLAPAESLEALDAMSIPDFSVVMKAWMQGATPKKSPSSTS
jgi:hypothetical protein